MSRITRRLLGGLSLAALAEAASAQSASAPPASAPSWPSRPIRMVVPFPPGGPTDIVARVLAERMARSLGQPVVVENRPGANGNIGNDAVAKAEPDGLTVLYNTSSIALSPALYTRLSYDAMRDLAPVLQTATIPLVLAVNPALPVWDLRGFVDYLRARLRRAARPRSRRAARCWRRRSTAASPRWSASSRRCRHSTSTRSAFRTSGWSGCRARPGDCPT